MADINVTRDSKLVKVIAARANNERIDSNVAKEADDIIKELATDFTPQNRHQIAQTVAFAVDELQKDSLDFLSKVADEKHIAYGDKAAFNFRTGHVNAYLQAKGATTARSMVGGRQILVNTEEVSARPAMNIMELRTGRTNMADLVREANIAMTQAKLGKIQTVLVSGLSTMSTPFYAAGTGVVKASLDAQLNHFRRLGPVTIIGDIAAVSQLNGLAGFAIDSTQTQHANEHIVEANNNGFIGRYNGCDVVAMDNAYKLGTITPILDTDKLYILPGNVSADMRNLKIVNEGSVQAFESQNIDDLVYEIRLDQWFGAALCVGEYPTIGMYDIN